ncbi:MAG: B12-binding domain-containing radical SAM protein [Phycisphaerae bacterium]|nr:B12-binding domain-containing radical SAM protein [Phycisphaerae bacterium]
MRILLVYPPVLRSVDLYSTPLPLGLLQVGGYLRSQGHQVRALNLELGGEIRTVSIARLRKAYADRNALDYVENPKSEYRQRFRESLNGFAPDIVGFSCATEQIDAARRMAEDVKMLMPKARVEFGDIRRASSAWVAQVSAAAFLCDPALDLLAGQNPQESFGAVLTSFGCPHTCAFCGSPRMYDRKVTFLPLDVVERRIRQAAALGANRFHLMDDTLTLNVRRAVEMADLMARIGLPWRTQTRADMLVRQPQLAKYFREHGCAQMTFGAESGSPRVLELMKKGVDPEVFLRAAEVLDAANMPYTVNFMIGYPGETDEDAGETMELIRRMAPKRVLAGAVVPYHGTELHDSRADVVREANKFPFCRWSPFDPAFLCDKRGNRFAGPSAAALKEFYGLVESANNHAPTPGTFSSISKSD